jgi:hypothetical protein
MATEGHECGCRGHQKNNKNTYMDLEFSEIRARMEKLAVKV